MHLPRRICLFLCALAVPLSGCRTPSTGGAGPSGNAAAATAPVTTGVRFEDVTKATGLSFAPPPAPSPLHILDGTGRGCGFLDFDNDGRLDILLLGQPRVALYRNAGGGRFEDVSARAGMDVQARFWMGCAVADVENDGDPDVLLTGYGRLVLFRNDGGKFTDATTASGLSPEPSRWYTSAAFGDIDRDGLLDLYVACYVRADARNPGHCPDNGIMTACGPLDYKPQPGVLYRNRGGGRFADATRALGAHTAHGRGLGALFLDYDGDTWIDLALANDETPGDLFHNDSGRLTNVALAAGTAYDVDGHVHGGMGIAGGDYDADGRLDMLVTVYEKEATSLYRQGPEGMFQDMGLASGVGAPTMPWVGFGCGFIDADNDGRQDVFLVNGHIRDNADRINPSARYAQPMQFLEQRGDGTFHDISHSAGPAFRQDLVGRGAAFGDYDNDGRTDILVSDVNGSPRLLRNASAGAGNWLVLRLIGDKSNRDAVGATVTVTAGNKRQVRQVMGGGSYLSASDGRIHVGMDKATRAESVIVHWPSGRTDTHHNLTGNRTHSLREGVAEPRRVAGTGSSAP